MRRDAPYGVCGTALLVEALLDRGTEGDVAEAQSAIDRAANLPADEGLVLRDIRLLRLRALLARARGDDAAYRDLADRYRAMAESLGFEGHIAWAKAMIEGGTESPSQFVPTACQAATAPPFHVQGKHFVRRRASST